MMRNIRFPTECPSAGRPSYKIKPDDVADGTPAADTGLDLEPRVLTAFPQSLG
jgi:hypothetical protein